MSWLGAHGVFDPIKSGLKLRPRKLPDRRPALAPSSTMPQVALEAAQEATRVILSTMLDSVAQGTAMFNQDHRLIGWNGQLQRLL